MNAQEEHGADSGGVSKHHAPEAQVSLRKKCSTTGRHPCQKVKTVPVLWLGLEVAMPRIRVLEALNETIFF